MIKLELVSLPEKKAPWIIGLQIIRIAWVIMLMCFVAALKMHAAVTLTAPFPPGAPTATIATPTTKGHVIVKVLSFISDKGVSAVSPALPHFFSGRDLMISQGIFHSAGCLGATVTSLYIHQDQWLDACRNGHLLKFTNHLILPVAVTIAHLVNIGLSFAASENPANIEMQRAQYFLIHLPSLLHMLNHGLGRIN